MAAATVTREEKKLSESFWKTQLWKTVNVTYHGVGAVRSRILSAASKNFIMAEARIAVAEPRVNIIDDLDTPETWKDVFKSWRSAAAKRYYKTRNLIYNGIWPASLSNLRIAFFICVLLMLTEPRFTVPVNNFLWGMADVFLISGFPRTLQCLIASCLASIMFFVMLMLVRQSLLRLLLAYRGWMYETPRNHSAVTKLWCGAVRLISGYQPSLYSCQRSLPRLPVPPVKDTLHRLYQSLRPLCSEDELKEIMQQGREFEANLAPKLQKLLILKSWISQNYVSDWWEKYVYLMSRAPLPNNSNYYCCDQCYWIPTHRPVSRAAYMIYNIMNFKRQIDREELQPLVIRNTIPICMAQYERLFNTVRIPGENMDKIAHFEDSKHIVVYVKGLYYKLDICDAKNQILSPCTLENQLNWIVEDAERQSETYSETEKSIAALTTLKRNKWAEIRKNYLSSGVNKESRRTVEKAVFCLSFVDHVPQSLVEKGNFLLHGEGKSIWFDKSLNVVIFANGSAGINCEHTFADAPAMAHMWEYALSREVLEKLYDENGYCMPFSREFKQAKIKMPQRLVWEVTPELKECIEEALTVAKKDNDDIDLVILDHNKWGKGAIKKCQVSPDAFIQLALQLAYYKKTHKFVQTYEASMTRLYLGGRTETVRSCTVESRDFVLSMVKDGVTREERIKLLKRAAEKHQNLYREAMNGKGIDRHLFALYVACKGLGYESDFLYKIITRPWTLSTSQTPHTQISAMPDANLDVFSNKLGSGGGFGPVSDDGYGVSYLIPSDNRLFFHVSSKHSCPQTSSQEFLGLIVESMEEMLALFQ